MLGQIVLFSFVGSVASLVGGVVLAMGKKKFSHGQSLLLVSFAAGVLLATAFFDLLPEAFEMFGEGHEPVLMWVFMGVIFLFLFEKSFLWYHHHHDEEHGKSKTPELLMVGDTMHNFIDGLVMGGAFLADPGVGMVTAIAIAAHEIPHEIADFGVLLSKGWTRKKTIVVNVVSASVAMAGAVLVYFMRETFEPILPYLLAFAGGTFLYLACSDLIPELHHEHKNDEKRYGLWEVVCFFGGIGIVYGLVKLLHGLS